MIRILAIDGGGCKGLIPIRVLKAIEEKTDCSIYRKFDLILGSSIGGLIGGVLCSRVLTASALSKVLHAELPQIFKKRFRIPFFQPKYSAAYKKALIEAYVGGMPMSRCCTKFICTGVDIVDGRTHFFKSWEKKDGKIPISDAIMRTTAAPLYFGSIVDENGSHVWIDGGCADYNSPAIYGLVEAFLQGWICSERVHILSLGCGRSAHGVPFKKAKNFRNIRQILFYADPVEGGLAREQVSRSQDFELKIQANSMENLSYQRIERYNLPKEMDIMDGLKYLKNYIQIGDELSGEVDYKPLL